MRTQDPRTRDAYRYEHFATRHLLADMRFDPGAPGPGDRLPPIELETTEGRRLVVDDLDRPHLFVFGSNTCPMTSSSADGLVDLHRRFGEQIAVVLVQVREAHPGELIGQPQTAAAKRDRAEQLRTRFGIPFAVAVDDLDGTFHQALDPKPNAAYLLDTDGTILFRSLWAADVAAIEEAMGDVAVGRPPRSSQSTRMVRPMLGALGHVEEVVGSGGRSARRDLWRAAPPMAVMGRLARLLAGTRRRRRTTVLAGLLLAVAAVAALAG